MSKVPLRIRQHQAARKKWREWAREFKGLDGEVGARTELRNIRLYSHGYEVAITRGKKSIKRCFYGFDEKALLAAVQFRDQVLEQLPPVRRNPIPPEVLSALGLTAPVVGISRFPKRSKYVVNFLDNAGRLWLKTFYYRRVSEVEAYAAAIVFLQRSCARGDNKASV